MTNEEFAIIQQNQARAAREGEVMPPPIRGDYNPEPSIRSAARNKYGVAPKDERTVDGILFASKVEAKAYCQLRFLQSVGEVTKLELQPVFKFEMGFEYRADFRVTYRDGRMEVIDVKGVETPVFKLKRKCMAHFYPAVNLVLWASKQA